MTGNPQLYSNASIRTAGVYQLPMGVDIGSQPTGNESGLRTIGNESGLRTIGNETGLRTIISYGN
jgi:hypothetical protein